MKKILLVGLLSMIGCASSIKEQQRLEENAAYMMNRYNPNLGDKTSFELSSPDSLVNVRVTKGEWTSESFLCNYIVQKNDTLFFSTKDGVVCKYLNSNKDYIWIAQ